MIAPRAAGAGSPRTLRNSNVQYTDEYAEYAALATNRMPTMKIAAKEPDTIAPVAPPTAQPPKPIATPGIATTKVSTAMAIPTPIDTATRISQPSPTSLKCEKIIRKPLLRLSATWPSSRTMILLASWNATPSRNQKAIETGRTAAATSPKPTAAAPAESMAPATAATTRVPINTPGRTVRRNASSRKPAIRQPVS